MNPPDGLDRIDLRGITAFGRHGVLDRERRDGQTFIADISLALDLGPAAQSGDLGATVDYGQLAQQMHDVLAGEPADLIESVALRMVDLCLARPLVRWASVTVHKPEAPIPVTIEDVSVTIERSKQ